MPEDREKTVVIATTRTAFEGDTIAAALRAEGLNARVVDASTSNVWGGVVIAPTHVIVMEHEAARARSALSQIRFEGQSVDWDAVDVGEPIDLPLMQRWSRNRRAMLTVSLVILPPIGLVTLAYGVSHADPLVQIMGGAALAAAVTVAVFLLFPGRGSSDPRQ